MGQRPQFQQRGLHLLLNAILFALCYPLTNYLALQAKVQANVLLPFEPLVPFIPWMLVPYISFPLLLAASFFMVHYAELQKLSRRMMLCTLVGCLIFALIPLHFPLERPELTEPMLAVGYRLLSILDQPYNQLPSLHIAYCVILWVSLPKRALFTLWLGVVVASTLLTWQHLLMDLAGGVALGLLTCWLVPRAHNTRQSVVFYYLAGVVLVLLWVSPQPPWLSVYLALPLALVARAYALNTHHFLAKQTGHHPLWVWVLYWPYLIGYRLCWQLVRYHSHQPWQTKAPWLLVGRRLSVREAETLPANCVVIDLSPELAELPILCLRYWHFPLFDMCAPIPSQLRPILQRLQIERQAGHTIYLHCAMGLCRSQFVADLYLKKLAPKKSIL